MKRKIITSVINNYEGDQRVQKVTNSLQKFGFDVEVVATNLRGNPKLNFTYPVHVLKLGRDKGMGMYWEFNWKLFWKLWKLTQKSDLLLANDVDALLPNYLVSKLKGVELVFDSHEIFSEAPTLYNRPMRKKIWRSLEGFILPKVKHFYTVSNGYADWFEKEYGKRAVIIRNVPTVTPNVDTELKIQLPELKIGEKVLIYQGVINFSRGIDKMIEAMQFLDNAQLWIIGNGPKKAEFEELSSKLKLTQKVKFLGSISPSQLKLVTPKADLGLSLEEDYGISYRYALPNKIFDYTHAGIPILGTYLPEIKQTIEEYGIGKTIQQHDAKEIAKLIQEMLHEGKSPYQENLAKAAKVFNWENEEDKLREIYSVFKVEI
jgi:glycosyltransferase involved in cell wall biosynthesis